MLMVRIGLVLSYVAIGSRNLVVVASVFFVTSVLLWFAGPIYTTKYLDVLEASFVLNACLLSIVITISFDSRTVATSLSGGLALVEFAGIVLFHTFLRLRNTRCLKNLISCFRCAKKLQVKIRARKSLSSREGEDHKTPCVTHSTIELRESLLESIQMHN